ncbi:hypothetical protein Tsubulata_050079 [Turnera subulata]|uniref:Zn-dependent metallo-hydrolase RNA specificity domain-containing protein n=1 Tax=Turnera subulata TaxID=218843 RepID=A0A9Q0FW38_9ROSI|nr:hypothetical protein Tsubulata_050079 [Turnera subulata]
MCDVSLDFVLYHQIHQLSFSPHTDSKGIMDLVKFLSPKHMILVHGEKPKMVSLKEKIQSELGIPCYVPANCDTVCVPSTPFVKAHASDTFIRSCSSPNFRFSKSSEDNPSLVSASRKAAAQLQVCDERVTEGILIMEKNMKAEIVHQDELLDVLGETKHEVSFAYCCPAYANDSKESGNRNLILAHDAAGLSEQCGWIQLLFRELLNCFSGRNIQNQGEHLYVESFHVSVCSNKSCPYRTIEGPQSKSPAVYFCCTWSAADEKLAREIISCMKNFKFSADLQKHC